MPASRGAVGSLPKCVNHPGAPAPGVQSLAAAFATQTEPLGMASRTGAVFHIRAWAAPRILDDVHEIGYVHVYVNLAYYVNMNTFDHLAFSSIQNVPVSALHQNVIVYLDRYLS